MAHTHTHTDREAGKAVPAAYLFKRGGGMQCNIICREKKRRERTAVACFYSIATPQFPIRLQGNETRRKKNPLLYAIIIVIVVVVEIFLIFNPLLLLLRFSCCL
jgi:predicted nucleic acid-binding Zn ribbon protein